MKDKIKALKLNITLSAVISIVIGILLLFYPTESISAIGKVIAVIIMLAGIGVIVSQIFDFGVNVMGIVVGGILVVIGIWIYTSTAAILSIIPIAIGVILVVHGIQDLGLAIEGARAGAKYPWLDFIIAALNILLGMVCIMHAFGIVNIAIRIIGAMLIFDGITDLGIVHKVRKATGSVVDSTITHEEDL